MKQILVFFRQQLRLKAYYIGTIVWAIGVLLSEIGKAKKDLIDSGMASQDSKTPLIFGLIALLFMGIACVFMLEIVHKLRAHFTKYHPTAWHFGLSFTWATLKLSVIVLLTMIPGIVYLVMNIQRIMIDPAQAVHVMGIFFLLQIIFVPLWLVVTFGAVSLSIARGTAYHTTRDSFSAFKVIWAQCLVSLVLMVIPGLLLIPLRILSLKFAALEYVAIIISVCLAPYSFGVLCAVYLYLARTLSERAPALVAVAEKPEA
jgi:hypothetical protein